MEASTLPTLSSIREIIATEAAAGTGAAIITRMAEEKPPVLHIGFRDLEWRRGPRLEITPHGMRAYRATLKFGDFSRGVFERMNSADDESHKLAISLIETAHHDVQSLDFPEPRNGRWTLGPSFQFEAISKRSLSASAEERIRDLSRNIIVPTMSALAELNGYDLVDDSRVEEGEMEGDLKLSLVRRRERNPRNRLLAIKIHGTACKVCREDHAKRFGFALSLVEVHHAQPLSQSGGARIYDPKTDLVPLCPTCHRAAHRRRPLPFSVAELKGMLETRHA